MEKKRHNTAEQTVSTAENKGVVSRMYEEGWGQGRLEVLDQAWAPTHVLHWNEQAKTDQSRTVAELKSIVSSYRAAYRTSACG